MTSTLTSEQAERLNQRITVWLVALDANYLSQGYTASNIHFELDAPGRKYCRVVQTVNGAQRSVHAFFDFEGNVYKAEGWKKPAKHVRFNLLDDASFQRMLDVLDWAGGYLYIR